MAPSRRRPRQARVLSQDDNIRRTAEEIQALSVGAVRMFAVTNGQLKAEAVTAMYLAHQHGILQRCHKQGPFFVGVYADRLEWLIHPPGM